MRHIADAECDRVSVHGCVGDRKGLCIAKDPPDPLLPLFLCAAHTLCNHADVHIADENVRPYTACRCAFGKAECDVSRTASDIQNVPAGLRVEPIHHRILPQAMDPPAHQIIHQVVPRCYGREDVADQAVLLAFRNIPEAERHGCFRGIAHSARTYSIAAMPELPEVETVRRGLQPVLEGHRILYAETRRADLRVPFSANFAARLKGRRVTRLRRRAKYLLAEMDNGETLVVHLG